MGTAPCSRIWPGLTPFPALERLTRPEDLEIKGSPFGTFTHSGPKRGNELLLRCLQNSER